MKLSKYLLSSRGRAVTLAEALHVSPQSVRNWANEAVPAERVISVWLCTNGKVSPHEMRPDIYPPELVFFNKEHLINV